MLSDRCLSVLSMTLVYGGQTLGWIKMKLGVEVGLGPGHIVLDGAQPPPPEKGVQQTSHSFRPMYIVAKRWPISATAELLLFSHGLLFLGCIAPLPKGAQPPIFDPCLLWPNGWRD